MDKNGIIEAVISGVNSEGDGIARVGAEGFVVFVKGALPGERVSARVAKVAKSWAQARAIDVLDAADVRRRPVCRHFGVCGGCRLQHASYGAQCAIKSRIVTDALARAQNVDAPTKVECVPSPREWGYRNKTALPVKSVRSGAGFIYGYYEEGSHRVVRYDDCAVLTSSLRRIVPELAERARTAGLTGYDERTKGGSLRHIAARSGGDGDERVIASFVVASELQRREFGRLRSECQKLAADMDELTGASININTDPGNFIWGPSFVPLVGARSIDQHLGRFRFETDISSFFQVNREQAHAMFTYVQEQVRGASASRVLELYAGVGSLTAYIAEAADHVDAVEEWRPAVRLMSRCMEMNGARNVRPIESSAEDFLSRAARGAFDTILLDPPRTGLQGSVSEAIAHLGARTIIYVSCSPATLARDLSRICTEGRYELKSVRAYDMFPQTPHVETVCVMAR